jgi:hypothetical protein
MGLISIIANKVDGISGKSAKLTQLNKEFQTDKVDLELDGQKFNSSLSDLKMMIVYNNVMLVSLAHTTMSDADYDVWVKEASNFTISHPKQSDVVAAFAFTSEVTSGVLVGKVIANLGKAFKAGIFSKAVTGADSAVANLGSKVGNFVRNIISSSSQTAEETALTVSGQATEDSIEAGAATASSSASSAAITAGETAGEAAGAGSEAAADAVDAETAIATTGALGYALLGAGIFVSLGISGIISGIDASKTAKELDKNTHILQKAVNSLQKFIKKIKSESTNLDSEIIVQQKAFISSMDGLSAISNSNIDYSSLTPSTVPSNRATFIATMTTAASYYGFLQTIRTNWINFQRNEKKHGRTATYAGYANIIQDIAPAGPSTSTPNYANMTTAQVTELIKYVAKHSQSLQKAGA